MDDRRQIGLTPLALQQLAEILETGWFNEGQEAARFALAYAVKAGVAPGQTSGVRTSWHTTLFDATGEITALLSGLYPEAPLVRTMEHFINEGLGMIHSRLVTEARTPADLLS